jgi:REP element-mobilizing transposase RayT
MGHVSWNLPTPPGFQCLDPSKPIKFYMRHLPHWRQKGATYFVTFRQADSLPQEKLQDLKEIRQAWEKQHPPPRNEEQLRSLAYETMRLAENWLDQGIGSCRLRGEHPSQHVSDALHRFDGLRYELGSYVIMPNHVHAIVRPAGAFEGPLEQIMKGWKGSSAIQLNRHFGLRGSLWQEESYDRIIRDEEHLLRAIQYIGANPAKAGLPLESISRWIRPAWRELGYRFDDE